ncbi:MAG TPA: oligoendopeptidase F [Abditibacteriaceae bacterium]|jgi:oligoendopeptidase F
MPDLQKPLPKREEVPLELTWDLTTIYSEEAAWETDFAQLEESLPSLSAHKGALDNAANVLDTLKTSDEVGILFGKLYAFASLRLSEDNANSDSLNRVEKLKMLGTRLSAATAWIEPELLAIAPETLRSFLQQGLEEYSYYFETLERRRTHVRSAEVEDVLALAREATGGTATVYKLFNNADLKFPEIPDEDGNSVELTHGRYINFLESQKREVRENAFKTMHGEYAKWRNTLAASLSGAVKTDVFEARVRHYDSALHAALGPDAIPTEVYSNLVSTVHERLPVLHRYLRLRKKLLKLDELQLWDLYVPMVASVEKPMPYEEAKQTLLDASAPLGETYLSILREGLENRWVDVLENEGKTSGAFSGGSYATSPYILMNWQDNLSNAFTLAHEFGHSAHSFLTRQNQPYTYANYTIFVAEVASTLNEALLTNHLQKQAEATGDRALQLYLLNSYAERFRTTLYRQTMFAEWELHIHQKVENGEALTAENLSESYLELNKQFYGAEVTVDECVQSEWLRIPHFYYGFYVYQYATGISAAAALAKQILEEGAPAVERYLNFLRGGSSKTSIDLLRGAGVDMASPAPIHQALDVFDELIGKMEALAE